MVRDRLTILIADDDPDDRVQLLEAWQDMGADLDIRLVEDGEQVLDYLHRRGDFRDPISAPRPGLVILDLNMPRVDGREVLREVKSNKGLRDIPVVVLTTSRAEEDVVKSYHLGANSYVSKPDTFGQIHSLAQELGRYWFRIVELP